MIKKIFYIIIILTLTYNNVFTQTAYEYYNKGLAELYYNSYEKAIEYFNSINESSNNYDVYFEKGICYYNLGKFNEAIQNFLIDEKLKQGRSSYYLAKAYSMIGNAKEAVFYLEKHLKSEYKQSEGIVKYDTAFANIQNNTYWEQLFSKNWYTEYEKDLEEVEYKLEVGNIYDAINIAGNLIRSYPEKPDLYIIRGNAYIKQGESKLAITDYNQSIELSNNNENYYIYRAKAYLKAGKYSEALSDCNHALNINPNFINSYYYIALINKETKQYQSAIDNINKYLNYYYKDDKAFYLAGILYTKLQDYTNAIKNYNKAIDLNKASAEYLFERATVYHLTNNYEKAYSDYSNALDLDCENSKAYLQRGSLRYDNNDLTGACTDWNKAYNYGNKEALEYLQKYCQ